MPLNISTAWPAIRVLSLRRQSKGNRKHNAASGKDADVVTAADRCRTSGSEGIGIGGSVSRNQLSKRFAKDGVAGNVVLVKNIVEGQTKFRLIEAPPGPDCVVEEAIGE